MIYISCLRKKKAIINELGFLQNHRRHGTHKRFETVIRESARWHFLLLLNYSLMPGLVPAGWGQADGGLIKLRFVSFACNFGNLD
jgi:hypothetical protein